MYIDILILPDLLKPINKGSPFLNFLQCIAFRDVNPVSPTHFLVIPRNPIPMLSKAADGDTEVGYIDTIKNI